MKLFSWATPTYCRWVAFLAIVLPLLFFISATTAVMRALRAFWEELEYQMGNLKDDFKRVSLSRETFKQFQSKWKDLK